MEKMKNIRSIRNMMGNFGVVLFMVMALLMTVTAEDLTTSSWNQIKQDMKIDTEPSVVVGPGSNNLNSQSWDDLRQDRVEEGSATALDGDTVVIKVNHADLRSESWDDLMSVIAMDKGIQQYDADTVIVSDLINTDMTSQSWSTLHDQ